MDVPKNLPDCVCFLCIEQGGALSLSRSRWIWEIPKAHIQTVTAIPVNSEGTACMPFVDLPLPPA